MIYPFPYISICFLRELPKKIIWIGGVSSKKIYIFGIDMRGTAVNNNNKKMPL